MGRRSRKPSAERGAIALPVLNGAGGKSGPRSKRGVWRASVLIAVHVVFAVHIVQWLIVGSTLSPVEPSEAMQTLEFGAINSGFIFFLLAILSTFLFGRFLCGWGCHVVALQDLCAWMMKKLGTRPKPFRSRLLVWAPLAFGLYMFVWPTFKRGVLFPILAAAEIERPVWIKDVPALRGFHAELIVTDFWASFPPWFVAIPFFVVIGFAAVYLLGSKGFCTYGCPYGGIFGPTDLVSPAKIKVNDSCDASGHCTAVCTSNVRVHEEVRDFGMVVDPGCMKCLDCVSACPTDALSFGYSTPTVLTKPKDAAAAERVRKKTANPKRFDLSLREELAVAAVFVLMFLGYRGFLNHVPMLMAAGMAGIGAFVAWKLWSLAAKPNVRLQRLQLKTQGRLSLVGVAVGVSALVMLAGAAWGSAVNQWRWRAHLAHEQIRVPLSVVLRPEYSAAPEHARLAASGSTAFARSAPIGDGGYGWSLRPRDHREGAFLALLEGDRGRAIEHLETLIRTGTPTDELVQHLGSVLQANGASRERVIEAYAEAVALHPELAVVRADLARLRAFGGVELEVVLEDWRDRLASPDATDLDRLVAVELFVQLGRPDAARELYAEVGEPVGIAPDERLLRARVNAQLGDAEAPVELLSGLVDDPRTTSGLVRAAVMLLAQIGRGDDAELLLLEGREAFPESSALVILKANLLLSEGDAGSATALLEPLLSSESRGAWDLAGIGEQLVRLGLSSRTQAVADIGLDCLRDACALLPGSATLQHDLGMALVASGRAEAGLASLDSAVSLAPENAAIAASRARVAAALGR